MEPRSSHEFDEAALTGCLIELIGARLDRPPDRKEIAQKVAEIVRRVEDDHPPLAVDASRFAERVVESLCQGGDWPHHSSDLFLACACETGQRDALERFAELYDANALAVWRRMNLEPAAIDELQQDLRNRLFVGDGRRPRIADYRGQGELASWVKATASRLALNRLRSVRREVDVDDLDWLASDDDPASDSLKREYRAEFRRAFATALTSLEPRQRLLLRQQVLDGVSVEELARLHQVHRVSVSRWLSAIRRALLDRTHRALRSNLCVDRDEADSIIRLISSRLEASFERLLASGSGDSTSAAQPRER